MQLRFASFAVINLRRDLHPQECPHAGRTSHNACHLSMTGIVSAHRLAASNARIGVAIAEYYPKLSLSGLIGSATSSGNLFTSGARFFSGLGDSIIE